MNNQNSKGVWIPPNWRATFEQLADAPVAELLRMALAYAAGDERSTSDQIAAALWPMLQPLIEQQLARQKKVSEARTAAINARWNNAAAAPVEPVAVAPETKPNCSTVVLKPLKAADTPAKPAKRTAPEPSPAVAELQRAVGEYYRRRPSTLWSPREMKLAAEVAKRPDCPGETSEILTFYRGGYAYARRDVATLLNNWQGELDRARQAVAPANTVLKAKYAGKF